MDKIKIENLEVFANHGVFPEEKKLGQKFLVSVELSSNLREAGRKDDLTKSIHYGEVSHFISGFMQKNSYQLIEAAAEQLAEALLLEFEHLESVNLEIKKPWAPIGLPLESVSVLLERSWHMVYLAFGSNLGEKEEYIREGLARLKGRKDCRILEVSDSIVTKPYGGVVQDDFLNGVLKMKTTMTPWELLEVLHQIEAAAGRERKIRWGPRTLDLDILFYDNVVIDSNELTIPHKDMQNRDFVLKPLMQIAPNYRHPIFHKTISGLYDAYLEGTHEINQG